MLVDGINECLGGSFFAEDLAFGFFLFQSIYTLSVINVAMPWNDIIASINAYILIDNTLRM